MPINTLSPKQALLKELQDKYKAAGKPPPKYSAATMGDLDYACERAIEGIYVPLVELHKMMLDY